MLGQIFQTTSAQIVKYSSEKNGGHSLGALSTNMVYNFEYFTNVYLFICESF